MPKVSAQYLAKKKKEIVEAAIRVCDTKPAYEVTLRDVVRECGISTGGIYNYFASIDEILVEILNQAYGEYSYSEELIKIFESDSPADEIIVNAFKTEGKMIDFMYGRYGKFIMELEVILLNDPERGMRMIANSKGNSENNIFMSSLYMLIEDKIAEGVFNPIIPVPHILFTVISAVSGLRSGVTTSEHTKGALLMLGITEEESYSAENLMELLAKVMLNLLEGNVK